jgi:hypothetical protein
MKIFSAKVAEVAQRSQMQWRGSRAKRRTRSVLRVPSVKVGATYESLSSKTWGAASGNARYAVAKPGSSESIENADAKNELAMVEAQVFTDSP